MDLRQSDLRLSEAMIDALVSSVLTQSVLLSVVAAGLALVVVRFLKSARVKGAIGERRVDRGLRRILPDDDYTIFADLTLPSRGGTTQIDHIVVSRFGVFVIETKNMRGWIFGKADQATWTQALYGKKTRFQNPLRQNYKHVKAVQDALGLAEAQICSFVVFVGSAEPRTQMPDNVAWSVKALARSIQAKQTVVLAEGEVTGVLERLASKDFQTTREDRRGHIQHVKQARAACPKCGAELVLRAKKTTGTQFLGCSTFPKCRGTRPFG